MGKRKDIRALPSVRSLQNLFRYNPESGDLHWISPRLGLTRTLAGSLGDKGYIKVIIEGRSYLAHRLIWKLVTGSEPLDQIDHIDGDRSNNRFSNLREATNGENRFNTKLAKNNRSGVKGVCWESGRRKWRAVITSSGDTIRLGRFDTVAEAKAAISIAREKMHGEFARAA